MEWVKGETIGHGSFATVCIAKPRSQNSEFPPLMAVKSCGASHSASLMNEKVILEEFRECPEIITCFGDGFSVEDGEKLYNVSLEYASGGALVNKVKNSGGFGLPEYEVRRYTNSILRGLQCIHDYGFVHCDVKLQNVLLFSDGGNEDVKIADFGLAKKAGVKAGSKWDIRGTPLYMSPEMVVGGEQEAPADIWALGCLVSEMVSGAPAWSSRADSNVGGLLMRIGAGVEVPEIPGKLSKEGKDFLGKCFLRDPRTRWTAEMLLNHPFVSDHHHDHNTVLLKDDQAPSTSPRCPFDFSGWTSCSITSSPSSESFSEFDPWLGDESRNLQSPTRRLLELATDQRPDWSVSSRWITVR